MRFVAGGGWRAVCPTEVADEAMAVAAWRGLLVGCRQRRCRPPRFAADGARRDRVGVQPGEVVHEPGRRRSAARRCRRPASASVMNGTTRWRYTTSDARNACISPVIPVERLLGRALLVAAHRRDDAGDAIFSDTRPQVERGQQGSLSARSPCPPGTSRFEQARSACCSARTRSWLDLASAGRTGCSDWTAYSVPKSCWPSWSRIGRRWCRPVRL